MILRDLEVTQIVVEQDKVQVSWLAAIFLLWRLLYFSQKAWVSVYKDLVLKELMDNAWLPRA